ncbi:hypothetical protein Ait01nite_013280 [Actinoplanes italicus]|uniref:Uncharacterized protein n=1 Tax=Actinoplanes italicus TaxID=113567 RepID=A0A2T0KH55_9ACTN|nr:hypothetical protein [Actinoplanes italicus]PRX22761.1 hypothetical protein CLV67_104289 [Actinoplanes italicus]GIE28283.1 hypothetical protein Ait01nite_013280 [Actinoplanes italicus]
MASASLPLAPTPRLRLSSDRWRWPRALLILPLPLLLVVQAREQHVAGPLLDRFGTGWVHLLAAAAAGLMCHVLVGRLTRRQVPGPAAALLVAAPVLAIFWAVPVDRWDLSTVIGLVLVTVALGGYLRFVRDANTLGGFVAGITLALAAACDLATLGYAAALAAAVPFVAGAWARQVSATTAILAVLAFPSIALYLGWLYVQWRFGATVLDGGAVAPAPDALDLARGAAAAGSGLLHAPLYLAVAAGVALRARAALPAYLLPPVMVALLVAVGVAQPPLVVNLLYTAVAVTAVRPRLPRRVWAALTAVAVAQAALVVAWPP